MYSCYTLTPQSKEHLRNKYPPKYPRFIGDHVTVQFGGNPTKPKELDSVQIVGYADDGSGCECFLVSVEGSTERPSGGLFHLTWSIDPARGVKPKDSNGVVRDADPITPITVRVIPELRKY